MPDDLTLSLLAHPDDTLASVLAAWEETGRPASIPLVVQADIGKKATHLYLVTDDAAMLAIASARDLQAAREVQERLLPASVPHLPGWDFAGLYRPAGVVGGDYWSVKFHTEENIITCKLADVTGHGLAAAILAAAVKFVSGVLFRYSVSPAQVMTRTNHSLLRETTPDKMVTMVYGWIYPDTGRARLVNAGHFPAFVCRAQSGEVEDVPPTGPLLCLMETVYDEWETHLYPGDVLFVCSDGIAEAHTMGPNGDERVKEIVQQVRHESAGAIADSVLHAARAGMGTIPSIDDMSLIVVKRLE